MSLNKHVKQSYNRYSAGICRLTEDSIPSINDAVNSVEEFIDNDEKMLSQSNGNMFHNSITGKFLAAHDFGF